MKLRMSINGVPKILMREEHARGQNKSHTTQFVSSRPYVALRVLSPYIDDKAPFGVACVTLVLATYFGFIDKVT